MEAHYTMSLDEAKEALALIREDTAAIKTALEIAYADNDAPLFDTPAGVATFRRLQFRYGLPEPTGGIPDA